MRFINEDELKVRTGVVESVRHGTEGPSKYVDLTVGHNHNFFAAPTEEADLALVHNCHGVPALATSRVLSSFNAKWVIGLSGTPARKITVEIQVAHHLIGDVIYETKTERLRPQVQLLQMPGEFQINNKMGRGALTHLQSKLEGDSARRKAIINHALKLVKQGHLVMIPLTRVRSILEWTRRINEEMERPGFAIPFYGGMPKDMRVKAMDRLRLYKSKIVVGNISMLSVGLNIPRASALIECGVTSNIPKAEQRFARPLTPMEGKPNPVIVFTLDNCDFMRRCRRNEFYNALVPKYDPVLKPEDRSTLNNWFGNEGGSSVPIWKDL